MEVLPRIGCYAANYYYVDHLVSIWQSLPVEARGLWWVNNESSRRLEHYGIDPKVWAKTFKYRADITHSLRYSAEKYPLLSASYGEWKQVRAGRCSAPYMPHGQGGPGNNVEQVWHRHASQVPIMFCSADRAILPGLNCHSIDGQPKVDRWIGHKPQNDKPIIAVSFRWRESTCALNHYQEHLSGFIKEASERGWEVLGHGHPLRWEKCFKPLWKSLGVSFTSDFEKVMRVANVYCADASSTSFEFAATDRPVVFLDCPAYEERRESMWHRFSHAYAGVTCNHPRDMAESIAEALIDSPEQKALRAKAVAEIFGKNDGLSSQRAAQKLLKHYSQESLSC